MRSSDGSGGSRHPLDSLAARPPLGGKITKKQNQSGHRLILFWGNLALIWPEGRTEQVGVAGGCGIPEPRITRDGATD